MNTNYVPAFQTFLDPTLNDGFKVKMPSSEKLHMYHLKELWAAFLLLICFLDTQPQAVTTFQRGGFGVENSHQRAG